MEDREVGAGISYVGLEGCCIAVGSRSALAMDPSSQLLGTVRHVCIRQISGGYSTLYKHVSLSSLARPAGPHASAPSDPLTARSIDAPALRSHRPAAP